VAQDTGSSPDGAPAAAPPTFTAAIDRGRGTIRVRGHLDRVAAEAVLASVGALRRLGHRQVTVVLAPGATADAGAEEVLHGLLRPGATDAGRPDPVGGRA
jgi:hypothetical protein